MEIGVFFEGSQEVDMKDIMYAHGLGEFETIGVRRDLLGDSEWSRLLVVQFFHWSFGP